MRSVLFKARIFTNGDSVCDVKVWVPELYPTSLDQRPGEDWVKEHLEEQPVEGMLPSDHSPEYDWQLLVEGELKHNGREGEEYEERLAYFTVIDSIEWPAGAGTDTVNLCGKCRSFDRHSVDADGISQCLKFESVCSEGSVACRLFLPLETEEGD